MARQVPSWAPLKWRWRDDGDYRAHEIDTATLGCLRPPAQRRAIHACACCESAAGAASPPSQAQQLDPLWAMLTASVWVARYRNVMDIATPCGITMTLLVVAPAAASARRPNQSPTT